MIQMNQDEQKSASSHIQVLEKGSQNSLFLLQSIVNPLA